MSSSPSTQEPSRYFNRFSERFKSLEDSPPREKQMVISTLKNSPLQPTYKDEHKIYEGEKYTSYEIPNEDRGEWRETEVLKHNTIKDEVTQLSVVSQPKPKSPRQPQSSTQQTKSPRQPKQPEQPVEKPVEQSVEQSVEKPVETPIVEELPQQEKRKVKKAAANSKRPLPQYMRATKSFYNRTHSQNESRPADNILRPRSQGGITKRAAPTSKIPRRQSNSTISALKNETKSPFVPMAARVKLFEKGLGNNGPNAAPVKNQALVRTMSSMSTSSNTSRQSTPSSSSSSSKVPRYAQQTSISMIRQELQRSKVNKAAVTNRGSAQKTKEPKPFHFSTNDRAVRHNRPKQVLTENTNTITENISSSTSSNGSKRKISTAENPIRPSQKPKHS